MGVVAGSQASSTVRRNEILETAAQLFASRGLRTSLQEIADACHIKPGSLYHHFESKEALVVELIERYQAELDQIADAVSYRLEDADPARILDSIVEFATAIAECAGRNSAAVQLTFYEPPAGAAPELAAAANRRSTAVQNTMVKALNIGRDAGLVRSGADLTSIADRTCQSMLHAGLGLFHRHSAGSVAPVLARMIFNGLAVKSPRNPELNRSAAFLAVQDVIDQWPVDDPDPSDRAAFIRSVARREFGRRGYEITTVRDVAAAAGLGSGSVYRVIGSKEELLASIMNGFADKTMAGWTAALGSDSTIIEKLDAAAWLQINVMERFHDEFRIQLAWMRQVPPDMPRFGWSVPALLKHLKSELAAGTKSGEIRTDGSSAELTARCVIDLTWIPENIVREIGKRKALDIARDTLLRGVATRTA